MALDPITDPPAFIANSERVTALYGGWPRFHDAEVLSLNFGRALDRNSKSPTLLARILAFHVDRTQTDEKDYFKIIGKYLVTIRFTDIDAIRMIDFNHQNVLAGLYFEQQQDGIEVVFDGIFGADLKFRCSGVTVDDVSNSDH